MRSAQLIEKEMAPALRALGLFCFGWFVMAEAPFTGRKAVLIGNRAENGQHGMWEAFRESPECRDDNPDPLDRWTKRVLDPVAAQHAALAIYPFGETLWPFQQFAAQATGMHQSPLGMLIHPDYGLWQAFRGVFVFGRDVTMPVPGKLNHPCDDCEEKPCLSACPVNAFSGNGFAVNACRDHLASGRNPDCMALGCRARAACPVGTPYDEVQIRFHMRAFGGNES